MRDSLKLEILSVEDNKYSYVPVSSIKDSESLPYALTVLLENVLRTARDDDEAALYAKRIVQAAKAGAAGDEVEFAPARVLFQDFTGVPVFVDFAAMREACAALGGDPSKINPLVPCDLVIDHSVIADLAGCPQALSENEKLEFQRNSERYSFLKWAQGAFKNVRIVPPGQGICHQLNIEKLASVVMANYLNSDSSLEGAEGNAPLAFFDTVVGTDSHTPTANGIGILGWGVGGIEAEAAALGQPISILVPPTIGIELTGALSDGVSAMDCALTFAELLRKEGVVGYFVECFGEGLKSLSATQRTCISNMTPEYGCTCTLFPVDDRTLEYLRLTGKSEEVIALVEAYAKAQNFWNDGRKRTYSKVITLDLSTVKPSAAGPSRPHDRTNLGEVRERFLATAQERELDLSKKASVEINGQTYELSNGAIAIAAVTSCTTATDPSMMLSCGLLAKKAKELGLKPKPWVKTILAPGSKATEALLKNAGLLEALQGLGFYTCGFGCMSCIGNSGPLSPAMQEASNSIELASVLSGNRNFEGRISPDVAQNYLMSPASVVAYAIAGTVDFSMEEQPLGQDANGKAIYLADIWPSDEEVQQLLNSVLDNNLYTQASKDVFEGTQDWKNQPTPQGELFAWDNNSTYVRKAPYFDGMELKANDIAPIQNARVLALLGDFVTTDHISPAGAFAPDSAAGQYLQECNVAPADFNTYGSRRGNHEVMQRGTFANVKLSNALAEGRKGGWTRDFSTGDIALIADAAANLAKNNTPAVVLAGKMYGSGSSRDWAAKGPMLLGVRAVIAESFERIHRSNLIGMGILPLQFQEGENAEALGLQGDELISIQMPDFSAGLPCPSVVTVKAESANGSVAEFNVKVRIDTPTEGDYYRNGGILQYVLRSLI